MLETIVDEAVHQATGLLELDAARAEAWASDLLALAEEADPVEGPRSMVAALASAETPATAAALHAVAVLAPELVAGGPPAPAPAWAAALGTARCDGAWLLRTGRDRSAALRFVDIDGESHVITVDLVDPGAPGSETVGEVVVGPPQLLEAVDEADAGIEREGVDSVILAARIVDALVATDEPSPTSVANGRLLAARLSTLVDGDVPVLRAVAELVPDPPERDPDDDRYAADVLRRAIGDPTEPDEGGLAAAASVIRSAALDDAPVARWLAAAADPELDGSDRRLVTSVLGAAVAPATLAPLAPPERDAVAVLEWADWLGAVIGAVRTGEGADVSPEALVDLVNRCPEVTTTIPKADRDRVAWAFSVCTVTWEPLGVAVGGRLTPLGAAVLPEALARAWIGDGAA